MTNKTFHEKQKFTESLEKVLKDPNLKITSLELSPCKDSIQKDMPQFKKEEYLQLIDYMYANCGLKLNVKGERGASTFEIIYKKNGCVLCDSFGADKDTENYIDALV